MELTQNTSLRSKWNGWRKFLVSSQINLKSNSTPTIYSLGDQDKNCRK